ncbi:MAG TPA: protein translocase subunit SecD, partial [Coriobacteriia bacterium]|nr:protein translocase subunit SecD [Coriobacteriia bacterium]
MTDRRFTVKKKASQKRPHVALLILLLVLVAGSVFMFWPPQDKITQGLDVQGGLSVLLTASKTDGSAVTTEEMERAQQVVERRVNLLGASEATVQVQGTNQLMVQMPGVVDQTAALNTIGSTGLLEFVDVSKITNETVKTVITSGSTYSRDYLVSVGAITPGGDTPVNAVLFTTDYQQTGDAATDEDAVTVNFPTSMTQDPLSGQSLPYQKMTGYKWNPVQLVTGEYTPIFSGSNITNVTVDRQSQGSPYFAVNITLDGTAASAFGATTTELAPTKGQIAILLDGYVQNAPAVQSAITDGSVAITGNYSVGQANQLRTILQSGSLPVSLEVSTAQVVGPTLGQDALRSGILVAVIGLSIVALYLLLFYKGIGFLTAAAIGVFAILYLGVLALLSSLGVFALSLAGIAGIVLAIGVAADSSILVLERFKEEIRMGRSVKASSMTGVKHAIITSIDADLVTLISALALFFLAVGSVQGFGLTLALGVI